jgi:hypothetical protein
MRHYYCEAEDVVVHDMRGPVTAREALQERELREALKRLSNFVDADVLLERNLLACTVRCLMCISKVWKLPLILTIPGARTPLHIVERQRTHTESLGFCGASGDSEAEDQAPVE